MVVSMIGVFELVSALISCRPSAHFCSHTRYPLVPFVHCSGMVAHEGESGLAAYGGKRVWTNAVLTWNSPDSLH